MKYFRILALFFFLGLTVKTANSIYSPHGIKPASLPLLSQRSEEIFLDFPEPEKAEIQPYVKSDKIAPLEKKDNEITLSNLAESPLPEKNIKPQAKSKKDKSLHLETAFAIFQRKDTIPENLEPKDSYPEFYRGIYITNHTTRNKKVFTRLVEESKSHNINTFVIDVQPRPIPAKLLQEIIQSNIHPVARIVIFDGGLDTATPPAEHMERLKKHMENACRSGFSEIQFDYIRYQDGVKVNLTIKQRYVNITGVINELKSYVKDCGQNLKFGADIFGRIPFNENDIIGQRVENFSETLDIIYPMLYPSHFYGQPARIRDPYQTVFDGVKNSRLKAKKDTKIIPYIQGFGMAVKPSGLTIHDYIGAQIKASYDSKSDGFIVWNALNNYKATFRAIENLEKKNTGNPSTEIIKE